MQERKQLFCLENAPLQICKFTMKKLQIGHFNHSGISGINNKPSRPMAAYIYISFSRKI